MVQSSSIITESGKSLERLSQAAYSDIRDRIVSLALPPGALLSENSLGAELGLSRTPIREALKRLEREYLVAVLPRRGIIVTEIDLPSQLQLIEMRRAIEPRLICRGVERSTPVQRRKMAELAARMETSAEAGQLGDYIRLDTEFDALIEIAAGNRFMADAMRPVHGLVRRFWHTQIEAEGMRQALIRHAAAMRAAGEGDPEGVQVALGILYDHSERHILSLLS